MQLTELQVEGERDRAMGKEGGSGRERGEREGGQRRGREGEGEKTRGRETEGGVERKRKDRGEREREILWSLVFSRLHTRLSKDRLCPPTDLLFLPDLKALIQKL